MRLEYRARDLRNPCASVISVLLASLLLLTVSHTGAQERRCPLNGSYQDDPRNFGAESAKAMIVRIRATFDALGEDQAPVTQEGVGFVVSVRRKAQVYVDGEGQRLAVDQGCGEQEVQVITARHTVFLDDAQDRWANRIEVYLPGGARGWQAAIPYKLASAQQPPPAEYDVVLLHAEMPVGFVWTGFRSALTLERGERLRIPQFGQAGDVAFRDITFAGIRVQPNLRLLLTGTFVPGDSGKPIFDSNWNVVGMFTTESGLATPADNLRLLLSGHGVDTNSLTVARLQERWRQDEAIRQKDVLRERMEENDGFTRFGVVRISDRFQIPAGAPLVGGRFGIAGGLPFKSYGPLGFEFVGGWQVTTGYQRDIQGFGELGVEGGIAGYWSRHRSIVLAATWSPSVVVFQGTRGQAFFPIASYSVNLQFGGIKIFGWRWHLGTEVRSVYPFGSRPSFVESVGYLAIAHGSQ